MNKTGIDWTEEKSNEQLEETLYFYTRNDYLIINNLLCGNLDFLWEVAHVVIKDNIGVLNEHDNGERPPLDDKTIAWLKSRIWEELDDKAKAEILEIAKQDIVTILDAMKPTKNNITLYRIIIIDDDGSRRPYTNSLSHNIGDIMEFKHISSTCIHSGYEETTGQEEKAGYAFYRYEITIPQGGYLLDLDALCQEDEILLPPMQCKITNIHCVDDNKNCKGVIEMRCISCQGSHFAAL
ncbi:MAG: ADP-ribosyltransferase [Oscillospiraceae bacterium]|nr:ADP-ribosyltransferase [Oscillospiraceae bacterium]